MVSGMPSHDEKTLATLQAAAFARPNDTMALLRLGEYAAKAGNAPLASEAYCRAGDIFLAQAASRRALAAFTNALQVARDGALPDRVARIARAVWKLDVSQGLTTDALATIDATARWLVERGFDADAVPLLEARIGIEDSEATRLYLADALSRLKLSERAVSELATVFMRTHAQGRRDKALEVGERLLGMRRDVETARACAKLYMARNRPGDAFHAIAKLRICHEANPKHVPTLVLLARAFELAGHPDKARQVLEEIGTLAAGGTKVRRRASSRPPPRMKTVTETSVISLSIADVEIVALERADALVTQRREDSYLEGPPPDLFGPAGKKGGAAARRGKRGTT
jgi:tetratricopeptide (TPR) repeat protein